MQILSHLTDSLPLRYCTCGELFSVLFACCRICANSDNCTHPSIVHTEDISKSVIALEKLEIRYKIVIAVKHEYINKSKDEIIKRMEWIKSNIDNEKHKYFKGLCLYALGEYDLNIDEDLYSDFIKIFYPK